MGDRFDRIIEAVLDREGPTESGRDQKTRWGVIQQDLVRAVALGIVVPGFPLDGVTRGVASAIFRGCYWELGGFDRIERDDLAGKILDMSLPMGIGWAVKCLQRALRACGRAVADDGRLGPITLSAVAERSLACPEALLAAYRSECAGYFRRCTGPVAEESLAGWLVRAYQ